MSTEHDNIALELGSSIEETEREPFSEEIVRGSSVAEKMLQIEYGFLEREHEVVTYLEPASNRHGLFKIALYSLF